MRNLTLSEHEQAMLAGAQGKARALAMRVLLNYGSAVGAKRLLEVVSSHIDGCLYHGAASLDFAAHLANLGGQVVIPTTLNSSSLDLLHPHLVRETDGRKVAARELMKAYVSMGCRATWTCAPYQLPRRPACGTDVAWAESNAIVFANSVLGARTERYGDFIDICAALTGRAPAVGLHLAENRRGEVIFDLTGLSDRILSSDLLFPALGCLIGSDAKQKVPVILGLPPGTTEDQLKALGAAAASSGSVALFHAVGVTPEAPTLGQALQETAPDRTVHVTTGMLRSAADQLGTLAAGAPIDAVSIGTPHFSVKEFQALVEALARHEGTAAVPFYVSTSRHVVERVRSRGWLSAIEEAGISLVVDTCTYITPILAPGTKQVMTNSGKWAYYAPGNLGVSVALGSLEECVDSAMTGVVQRHEELWRGR